MNLFPHLDHHERFLGETEFYCFLTLLSLSSTPKYEKAPEQIVNIIKENLTTRPSFSSEDIHRAFSVISQLGFSWGQTPNDFHLDKMADKIEQHLGNPELYVYQQVETLQLIINAAGYFFENKPP